ATELLVEKGYDPTMGARPLRRAIQKFIEDPLADFVLGRELKPGATILVDKKRDTEDEVELTIIPGAPPEEPEKVTVPPEEPAAGPRPSGSRSASSPRPPGSATASRPRRSGSRRACPARPASASPSTPGSTPAGRLPSARRG